MLDEEIHPICLPGLPPKYVKQRGACLSIRTSADTTTNTTGTRPWAHGDHLSAVCWLLSALCCLTPYRDGSSPPMQSPLRHATECSVAAARLPRTTLPRCRVISEDTGHASQREALWLGRGSLLGQELNGAGQRGLGTRAVR